MITPASFVLTPGQAATVAVSNPLTANPGSVTVTKNITGVAASVITGGLSFPFTVACSTPTATYSGTVTVNAGSLAGNSTVTGIPSGSTSCTIAEGSVPTAPSTYAWGAASYTQPAAAALPGGGSLTGAINNPLSLLPVDPPVITKLASISSFATNEITWTVVVSNTAPANASLGSQVMLMEDPLPGLASFVAGSVSCAPSGGATITSCGFDSVVTPTKVVVNGVLPFGAAITVTVKTTSAVGTASIANTARASFPATSLAVVVVATALQVLTVPVIPALDDAMLLLLIGLLALITAATTRKRIARR